MKAERFLRGFGLVCVSLIALVAVIVLNYAAPLNAGGVTQAVLVMAAAASTTTTVQVNYVPQGLFFTAATVPTLIKVTPLGDGPICDLDGNGVTCLGRIRLNGIVTNSYYIPLADGLVPGRTTEIVFTNAVASTVNVYGFGMSQGSVYIQCLRQTVLANSGTDLFKFMFAGFPSGAAGDVWNITSNDGVTQKYVREELQGMIQFTQNDVTGYNIDNLDQKVKNVQFVPAATQVVYIARVSPIGVIQKGIF